MTKESVERIIREIKEDGEYWIITTNIPRGKGINGVDYLQYSSCSVKNRNEDYVTSSVISFMNEYVQLNIVIRYHTNNIQTSVVYLPYEQITCIVSQRNNIYSYHSLGDL